MTGEDDKSTRGSARPDPHKLEDFYRARAAECVREAEATTDPKQRQQWKRLAFEWTQLALHAK